MESKTQKINLPFILLQCLFYLSKWANSKLSSLAQPHNLGKLSYSSWDIFVPSPGHAFEKLAVKLELNGTGSHVYQVKPEDIKTMSGERTKIRVLFVCLGNICRSPMAACILRHLVRERGEEDKWTVHSAGIGNWYVGGPGDNRMLMTLKKHKIVAEHRVRQVRDSDFGDFDYIFGMDEENMKALRKMAPENCQAKIQLFGEYDPCGKKIVRDPYYDHDLKGFEEVFEQCMRCSKAFLDSVNS